MTGSKGFIPLSKVAEVNSAFSPSVPGLQLFWDATSKEKFDTCPRLYFYTIIQGYQQGSTPVDLTFGIAWHSAIERYHRLSAAGLPHEEALLWTVAETYFRQLLSSHEEYLPEDSKPEKTKSVLIRSLVAYLDHIKEDSLQTIILASGKAATELSFSIPISNTPFFWCGHIDRLASQGQLLDMRNPSESGIPPPIFVTDYKTTTSALDARYWAQWDLSTQMSGYLLGGKVFLPSCRGLVVDATKLSVTGQEFGRYAITKTSAQLDDFFVDLLQGFEIAQAFARAGRWPRNPTSCIHYGKVCAFHDVCKCGTDSLKEKFLEANFTRRFWNPSINRI